MKAWSALVVATCVVGMLLPRSASGQPVATLGDLEIDRDALRIRVHATSGVHEAYVRQAVDVARGLLASAGVVTAWSVCVPASCPVEQVKAFEIVAIFEKANDRTLAGHCGRAALGDMTGRGTVRVSVPCVAAIALRLRQRLDTGSHPLFALASHHDLTGAILAHEVGHVLGLRHGPTGLMRERLDRNDVLSLRSHRFTFAAPDVATMQRNAELATGRARSALARR